MRLIDADKLLKFFTVDTANQTYRFRTIKKQIEDAETVKAIDKSVIDDIINKLIDLADHKIKPISFDQELAINMCIDIINKTIAEREENKW